MKCILLVALFIVCSVGQFLYYGTAESGMEFGSAIPGVYNVDYTTPNPLSIQYMKANGLNTIRLPFLWERLQASADGSFDSEYFYYITSTVSYITLDQGMFCLLDVHNYARYYGNIMTDSEFYNLWYQLASFFKNNTNVVFGLMNEPNSMPNEAVVSAMQAGINAVRAAGATNLITVAGDSWTGVHSWYSSGNAQYMGNITDPQDNFMYEMHQYFDDNFSGTGPCNPESNVTAIFDPATAWLRSLGRTAWLGEFGIESTSPCLPVLQTVMQYLQENNDVWRGFTWWSAGPWWGNYMYSIEPLSYNPDVPNGQQLQIISKYLP